MPRLARASATCCDVGSARAVGLDDDVARRAAPRDRPTEPGATCVTMGSARAGSPICAACAGREIAHDEAEALARLRRAAARASARRGCSGRSDERDLRAVVLAGADDLERHGLADRLGDGLAHEIVTVVHRMPGRPRR